ncbi:KilA-N domain-containing protein [Roseateles sp. SL47]|uniref:KilA-N domain-containing protein n=1 Tax=Roseateles sp. SL47 TaxID=2995138 RepID=UPI002271F67C|nr:KilA-N domain-containing protein [Roseateles sp. SL47]WAC70819.1 KilA-N domain-containing protein [Roseateles sp. SL47]
MAATPSRTAPFILEETYVRQDAHGRYSLNDLHAAAGGEKRHQPTDWLRLEQTQALIAELSNSGDSRSYRPAESSVGRYGGTYVVRELVYAYAMWISPAFNLKVIRAFMDSPGQRSGGTEAVGVTSGLTTSRLISLQEQSWKLITRLRAERDPELRATLHAQLGAVLGDLGQAPVPLSSIGYDRPLVPPEVTSFWQIYAALEAKGVRLNHSRQAPSLIAVNMRQFGQAAAEHKLRTPPQAALKLALRKSVSPKFLDTRNVNSAILGNAVHCWVFDGAVEGAKQ